MLRSQRKTLIEKNNAWLYRWILAHLAMIKDVIGNLVNKLVQKGRTLFFSNTDDTTEMLLEFSVYLEKIMSLMSLGILSQDVWKHLGTLHDKGTKDFSERKLSSGDQKQVSFNFTIVEQVTHAVLQGKRAAQGLQEALYDASQKQKIKYLNRRKRRAGLESFKLLNLWWDLSLCWKISESYGVPLNFLIAVFHTHVEDRIKLEYRRTTALSGPIMTVKIMLVLPFTALVMTACMGLDTIHFLIGTPFGWLCCLCAAGALIIARRWAESMIAKVQDPPKSRNDSRRSRGWKSGTKYGRSNRMFHRSGHSRKYVVDDIALIIDLLGGLLECGMSLDSALEVLELYVEPEILQKIKTGESRQKQGKKKHEQIELDAVISLIGLSRKVGVPSRKMLGSHAQWLRRKHRYDVERKLEALGVKIVLPLGICVLPAFFCLSVIPVVVALASGLF